MVYHVNAHTNVAHPLNMANSLYRLMSVWDIPNITEFHLCNVDMCVLGGGVQRRRVCPCATLACVEIILQRLPVPFPGILF